MKIFNVKLIKKSQVHTLISVEKVHKVTIVLFETHTHKKTYLNVINFSSFCQIVLIIFWAVSFFWPEHRNGSWGGGRLQGAFFLLKCLRKCCLMKLVLAEKETRSTTVHWNRFRIFWDNISYWNNDENWQNYTFRKR